MAGAPPRAVRVDGHRDASFRLGDELVVRLPLRPSAVAPVQKEWQWLPRLAPHLPLPIPAPLAVGEPGEVYPWRWSVGPWLRGENATPDRIGGSHEAATQLAEFIRALQRLDPAGGPPPSRDNFNRGVPLSHRDESTRRAIAALGDEIDGAAATRAWETALAAPGWQRDPIWLHGDLLPGNLLAEDGRLTGVLDFETLGIGDPACDVVPAWAVFTGDARQSFRAALEVDDATWARGRGWALSQSLTALPYYRATNPRFADLARHTIREVLADQSIRA